MTDIIERLRRERDEKLLMEASQLLYEAADEIERLRAALLIIANDTQEDAIGDTWVSRSARIARAALEGK